MSVVYVTFRFAFYESTRELCPFKMQELFCNADKSRRAILYIYIFSCVVNQKDWQEL